MNTNSLTPIIWVFSLLVFGIHTQTYSTILSIHTIQNGNNYCSADGGTTTDEHIGRVQLGEIDKISTTTNAGYSDFTSESTGLTKGTVNTITVTSVMTTSITYWEAFKVWIDYNHDNDFEDPGELVWEQNGTPNSVVSGNFIVPSNAINGSTRMRVRMTPDSVGSPCGTPIQGFGEVEDYTVIINGSKSNAKNSTANIMKLYPNPAVENIIVSLHTSNKTLYKILDVQGGIVSKGTLNANINVSSLKKGIYFLQIIEGTYTYRQRFVKK